MGEPPSDAIRWSTGYGITRPRGDYFSGSGGSPLIMSWSPAWPRHTPVPAGLFFSLCLSVTGPLAQSHSLQRASSGNRFGLGVLIPEPGADIVAVLAEQNHFIFRPFQLSNIMKLQGSEIAVEAAISVCQNVEGQVNTLPKQFRTELEASSLQPLGLHDSWE